ncbi:MAG: type II toxin-antitoxin system HipA family toxin [Anaerolineales bacterium]|nr:type II toxin-antitoxin system HipA family toxin [Anaerolineales bacterium]
MTDAKVRLWGSEIGAVSWLENREIGVFQYTPDFLRSGIQVSPLMMPLNEFPYEFPALAKNTFRGLPGLLADSLPDRFGNAVIDAWLASQGRTAASFNPVERLSYIGIRGMGALEYKPTLFGYSTKEKKIELEKLVELVNKILDQRAGLKGVLTGTDDHEVLEDILRVGTSAGGARAKAILAWNPNTKDFRSGQLDLEPGFEHWLLKFDGITNNRDKEIADPIGYGKIEYAYHTIAVKIGINMMECTLHHEGGRSHFMTKRFDRTENGGKIHVQTLGAIAHYDYNLAGSNSYEQAIHVMKRLGLSREDIEQQVLRTIFNIIGRNQDDHVKNIAFLMDRGGNWTLSPAYDLIYSWNPKGDWTSQHQMSVNNKRDNFLRADLVSLASIAGIKKQIADDMINRVISEFKRWADVASSVGVASEHIDKIQFSLRLNI